jgi:hypothetical protein
MRCSDILTLNLMAVGILHGAIAFTGELFGAVGVVTAAKYIVSLDVAITKASGTLKQNSSSTLWYRRGALIPPFLCALTKPDSMLPRTL